MAVRTAARGSRDLDGLRLLALSRIPRCGSCPRFRSLVEAHAHHEAPSGGIPAVPAYCTHAVCAPLVERLDAIHAPRRAEPRPAPGPLRLRAS